MKKDRLTQVYIHVTHQCNMNCIGCNAKNLKDPSTSMRMEDIFDIVVKLKPLGLKNLVLTGGEPFLRKDILDICKNIKTRIGIENLTVLTNGNFEFDTYAHVSQYIDNLIISIDGYDEDTIFLSDVFTVPKILKNVDKLKKMTNCSLEVKIHKKNKDDVDKYIDLSTKLGAYISFNLLNLCKDDELYEEYILNAYDVMDISHSILGSKDIMDPLEVRMNRINIFCDSRRCRLGCNNISIDVNGDIYPCRFFQYEEVKLGNIFEDTIMKILRINDEITSKFDVENINACKNCEHKYLCKGGCRARSFLHNGTLYNPDVYCEFLRKYFNIMKIQEKKEYSYG